MKKIKYLIGVLLLSVIVISCKREFPENYPYCDGCGVDFTNKYILTDINTQIIPAEDTVNYKDLEINVNLFGSLVSENVSYVDALREESNPGVPSGLIEQKYFVNKVVSFEVYPDCVYNDSIASDKFYKYVKILLRNEKHQYYNNFFPYYEYSSLGYTPVKIKLSLPPDTPKWVSFIITIKDDKGNVFTTTTDKIFVTK